MPRPRDPSNVLVNSTDGAFQGYQERSDGLRVDVGARGNSGTRQPC